MIKASVLQTEVFIGGSDAITIFNSLLSFFCSLSKRDVHTAVCSNAEDRNQ